MSKSARTENRKASDHAYYRRRMAALTPEQKAALNDDRRRRRANRTPEQIEKDAQTASVAAKRWRANRTTEQIEKEAQTARAAAKRRRATLTPERKRQIADKAKRWLKGLSEAHKEVLKARWSRYSKSYSANMSPERKETRRLYNRALEKDKPSPSLIANSWGADAEVIKSCPELRQAFTQLIKTRRALREQKTAD